MLPMIGNTMGGLERSWNATFIGDWYGGNSGGWRRRYCRAMTCFGHTLCQNNHKIKIFSLFPSFLQIINSVGCSGLMLVGGYVKTITARFKTRQMMSVNVNNLLTQHC
jgi:hypothetical protein